MQIAVISDFVKMFILARPDLSPRKLMWSLMRRRLLPTCV